MTEIEEKALALLNEVELERGSGDEPDTRSWTRQSDILNRNSASEALCRAIEQHEAFRQEVSDAVCEYKEDQPHIWKQSASGYFSHLINPAPKPDPLAGVLEEVTCYDDEITFKMEIRSKNDD